MRRKWDKRRFAAILDDLRADTAETYEDLGRKTGVSPATLSRWRLGQVAPDIEKVLAVALWVRDTRPELTAKAEELFPAAGFGALSLADYEPALPPDVNRAYDALGEALENGGSGDEDDDPDKRADGRRR